MRFLKKYKTGIIISTIACLVLAGAFLYEPGRVAKKSRTTDSDISKTSEFDDSTVESQGTVLEIPPEKALEKVDSITMSSSDEGTKSDKDSEPLPEVICQSEQSVSDTQDKKDNICTLSVRCDVILSDMAHIDESKRQLIPVDGKIFFSDNIEFFEDETVFNILLREMKKNKIHIDFVNTPMYNSVYVRGISNIYEKDFGELSGWKYKVNGETPSLGCSKYKLSPGDIVEWTYTLTP